MGKIIEAEWSKKYMQDPIYIHSYECKQKLLRSQILEHCKRGKVAKICKLIAFLCLGFGSSQSSNMKSSRSANFAHFFWQLWECFLLDFRSTPTAIESGAELAKQKSRNWAVLLVYYIPRSI